VFFFFFFFRMEKDLSSDICKSTQRLIDDVFKTYYVSFLFKTTSWYSL